MQYRVLRDTYGFKGRFWAKGEVVEIDPKEKPPRHFAPVNKPTPKEPEPGAMIADKAGGPSKPGDVIRGGVAASVQSDAVPQDPKSIANVPVQ
jgi:hypothetical protein